MYIIYMYVSPIDTDNSVVIARGKEGIGSGEQSWGDREEKRL